MHFGTGKSRVINTAQHLCSTGTVKSSAANSSASILLQKIHLLFWLVHYVKINTFVNAEKCYDTVQSAVI